MKIEHLPGVGGVEPLEFEDLEFNKLSKFEDELVLLQKQNNTIQAFKQNVKLNIF